MVPQVQLQHALTRGRQQVNRLCGNQNGMMGITHTPPRPLSVFADDVKGSGIAARAFLREFSGLNAAVGAALGAQPHRHRLHSRRWPLHEAHHTAVALIADVPLKPQFCGSSQRVLAEKYTCTLPRITNACPTSAPSAPASGLQRTPLGAAEPFIIAARQAFAA